MLSSGEGRPTDIDVEGKTCLCVSRDYNAVSEIMGLTLI
jgi:hypothetical protein